MEAKIYGRKVTGARLNLTTGEYDGEPAAAVILGPCACGCGRMVTAAGAFYMLFDSRPYFSAACVIRAAGAKLLASFGA